MSSTTAQTPHISSSSSTTDESESSSFAAENNTATDGAAVTTTTTTNPPFVSSKNQQKRQARRAQRQHIYQAKKQERKDQRRAAAIASGRDLEAEQAFVAARTASGDRQRRLAAVWAERTAAAQERFQICLDCSFEQRMWDREVASLAKQIRYCYAYNRSSPNPVRLVVTSLQGETLRLLQKEAGFDQWHKRAFTATDKAWEDYYCNNNKNNNNMLSHIVYLTSDATTTLEELDDTAIYVIGGIVDRNRLGPIALHRATSLGVTTAKLPLDEHLAAMPATKVLTCNHVVDIMLKYREYGNDWSKALQAVLPLRKHAEFREQLKSATAHQDTEVEIVHQDTAEIEKG